MTARPSSSPESWDACKQGVLNLLILTARVGGALYTDIHKGLGYKRVGYLIFPHSRHFSTWFQRSTYKGGRAIRSCDSLDLILMGFLVSMTYTFDTIVCLFLSWFLPRRLLVEQGELDRDEELASCAGVHTFIFPESITTARITFLIFHQKGMEKGGGRAFSRCL